MKDRELQEILTFYFEGECTIKQGPSGMNNLTRYIEYKGKQYVLRVYQNHQDVGLVRMEHRILGKLQHFNVPTPVESKLGETVVEVKGNLATLFEYKEGRNLVLQRPSQYYDYGQRVGCLSEELSRIEEEGEYLPYYEWDQSYRNHGAWEFCGNVSEGFRDVERELEIIRGVLEQLSVMKEAFRKLPHQLIHGDVNCSNLLMDEKGKITTILDFEFVTYDLRVMEVAICLSELLHEVEADVTQMSDGLMSFCQGYRTRVCLNEDEIEYLPWLILLRRLDVFLHFLVRYRKGIETENIDSVAFLKKQIRSVARQESWLRRHQVQLQDLFR